MSQLLANLNENQRQAITTGAGPILVLAGPGSGKTRVLTHRIAYLIQEMNVPPDAIVAVTFTNKAAGEMRARIENLLGAQMRGLRIGTFHAICAYLLRVEGERTPFGRDYVIYDTDDQLSVIKQAAAELSVDKKHKPRAILGKISAAKNELITPDEYHALDYFGEIVARVYPRYQEILLDNNALDFDDLLMKMVFLLRDDPYVLQKYQSRFEFVLVDEFQDTNTAQYALVELLSAPQNNVFVVGDEDQSIYAFRGADYRNVLRFRESYPGTQVILLEQNYRSTQVVLDAARAVIDKNTHRTPKALFTERKGGALIEVQEAYNEEFEARYVSEKIEELRRDDGLAWKDFAVMYRINAQSRALEAECIRQGIPYRLIGGVGFYKRREVRDVLAYLRLINNPNDKVSFSRVANVPRRGIGKKSLTDFQRWAAIQCENYDDALDKLIAGEPSAVSGRGRNAFVKFGTLLKKWRELVSTGSMINLFDTLMSDIGYSLYLNEISDTPEQSVERAENIQELRGLISTSQDEEKSLAEFLVDQSLVSDVDDLDYGEESVTLLTLHAAKGLEFPIVFITGVEEGMLPHIRAFDEPEGMTEERRLLYVGITRAEDRLFLTHSFRRSMYGNSHNNAPSRFLADLPSELVDGLNPKITIDAGRRSLREQTVWEPRAAQTRTKPITQGKFASKITPFPGFSTKFKTNERVIHEQFGEGSVIESKSRGGVELVTVIFDTSHSIKKIDADMLSKANK
jgi:DNA helicase II / ATP-dependent DNA helicase PcrA